MRNNNNQKRNLGLRQRRPKIQSNVREALDGRAVIPRADPPTIVEVPWNSITLTFEGDGTGGLAVTTSSVAAALAEIYPITVTEFDFRIRSLRAWETTGKDIAVNFNSLDSNSSRVLMSQDDSPARNQWARVGYVWPRSHQNLTLTSTTLVTPASFLPVVDSRVLVHVDILWRRAFGGVLPERVTVDIGRKSRRVLNTPAVPVAEHREVRTSVICEHAGDVLNVRPVVPVQPELFAPVIIPAPRVFPTLAPAQTPPLRETPSVPEWDLEGPVKEWTKRQWHYYCIAHRIHEWDQHSADRHDDWIQTASGKCGAYYNNMYGMPGLDMSGLVAGMIDGAAKVLF